MDTAKNTYWNKNVTNNICDINLTFFQQSVSHFSSKFRLKLWISFFSVENAKFCDFVRFLTKTNFLYTYQSVTSLHYRHPVPSIWQLAEFRIGRFKSMQYCDINNPDISEHDTHVH